ncbi:Uncharacterised protein [Edwardsiella ictaluri]|nr:Uncharacterised protein [Edwardsiella ictaluri]
MRYAVQHPGHVCRTQMLSHAYPQLFAGVEVEIVNRRSRHRQTTYQRQNPCPKSGLETGHEAAAAAAGLIYGGVAVEAQRQPLLTVEAVDPCAIIMPSLTLEHPVYPVISVVNSRFGALPDTQAQCAAIGSNGTIPLARSAKQTCLALAPYRRCQSLIHSHRGASISPFLPIPPAASPCRG